MAPVQQGYAGDGGDNRASSRSLVAHAGLAEVEALAGSFGNWTLSASFDPGSLFCAEGHV